MNDVLSHFDTPFDALEFLEKEVLPVPLQFIDYFKKPSYDLKTANEVALDTLLPRIESKKFIKIMALYFRFHSMSVKPIQKFIDLYGDDTIALLKEVSNIPPTAQFICKSHIDQKPTYYRIDHTRMLVEKITDKSQVKKIIKSNDNWSDEPPLPLVSFEVLKEQFDLFPVRSILHYAIGLSDQNMHIFVKDNGLDTSSYMKIQKQRSANNAFLGLDHEHPISDNPFSIPLGKLENYRRLGNG
jgi:hypothetical protein